MAAPQHFDRQFSASDSCASRRAIKGSPPTSCGDPKRVIQDALELPTSDRIDVFTAIADSLDGIDFGEEWEEEIRRRIADVDSGRTQTVPGDKVFSRIEQRLRTR